MILNQITWDAEDGEPLIDAVVTRSSLFQGQLIILYSGTDRYTQQPYDGRINLQFARTLQVFDGTYSSGGQDVAFTLTGRFTDDEYLTFEGRWVEPGWTSRFSF